MDNLINYFKYKKYKNKYKKLKLLYSNNKKMKNTDFDKEFNDNMHNSIMKLEFYHDLDSKKVKNNKFYDLVKQKELEIDENVPVDKEDYLKQIFINYSDEPLKDKITIDPKPISIKDLSNFTAVFDNITFTNPIINKITKIFNINEYYKTFIGNCEEFLNGSSEIEPQFLDSKKNLKLEFLREAVLIGFLPKSKNYLLSFSQYNDFKHNSKYTDKFETELKRLLLFCNEAVSYKKKLNFNGIQLNFFNDLIKIKNAITIILTKSSNNEKKDEYDLSRDLIEKVIFSMKEARDSFYINEMLEIQKINPDIIFITTDKILTFRCVFNKISVINILNGMIRYLIICKDSNIKVIGNPFEIFNNSESITNTLSSKKIKDIITDIIENPIMSLKQNFTYYNKYLINSFKKINTLSFIVDCAYNFKIRHIDEPNQKTKEIMKTLYDASYGVSTLDDLKNILKWISYNLIDDKPNNVLNFSFDKYKNNILDFLIGVENDIRISKQRSNFEINDSSTFRFLFIECFGCITGQFLIWDGLFYLLKMIKKFYPESKWNYKEIFILRTCDNLNNLKEDGESFHKLILRLINNDETVFNEIIE